VQGDALTLSKTPPAEAHPDRTAVPRGGGSREKPDAAGADRDAGTALRSVYQQTVEEAVPDEMLDLLSKLD
jgi:hypothetical protein